VKLPPFQALLDEHRVDVYRYCVATAGRSEADECFQETWIAALRAYPELRRADNLRAWLFRIAHNKAMDLHRSRARRPVPVESVPERAGGSPGAPRSSAGRSSECPMRSSRGCSSPPRTPPGATSSRDSER
jgi:RNA polymerase sigma factor (sigma-70 family)